MLNTAAVWLCSSWRATTCKCFNRKHTTPKLLRKWQKNRGLSLLLTPTCKRDAIGLKECTQVSARHSACYRDFHQARPGWERRQRVYKNWWTSNRGFTSAMTTKAPSRDKARCWRKQLPGSDWILLNFESSNSCITTLNKHRRTSSLSTIFTTALRVWQTRISIDRWTNSSWYWTWRSRTNYCCFQHPRLDNLAGKGSSKPIWTGKRSWVA